MRCPDCGSPMKGKDCPYCGYGIITKEKDEGDNFIKNIRYILVITMIISFTIYLIVSTAVMILSTTHAYSYTTEGSEWFYMVLLLPIGIAKLSGLGLTVFYFLLIAAVIISLAYLLYRSADFLADVDFKDLKKKELSPKIMDQPLTRLALMFCVMTFLSYLYFILIGLAGTAPTTPPIESEPFGKIVYVLTQASVWEEIMFRSLYFGVPMMIYGYSKNDPDAWKNLFGGFGTEDGPVLPLILLSSFIFSIGHLGDGWDLFKFPQVFIGGLIFGYLFTKDGLYSCIIFHFAWDYTYIFGQISPEVSAVVSIVILAWMGIGVYFTYHYLKTGFGWLKNKKKKRKTYQEKEEEVDLLQNAGFICSNCRSYKAVYTPEGKLKCKICGNETELSTNDSFRKLKPGETKRMWPPID
ncbi:MAG: CPBP family glutamic-type intramembrane protease [Thermoplasmata archaeon]